MRKLKIDLPQYFAGIVFSSKPFQKEGSYELIEAAKFGDLVKIQQLLRDNRNLVYDFDYIGMTALHWACKRNHELCALMLIEHNSNINAKDLLSRFPIYFAIENKNKNIVKELLAKHCNPWSSPQNIDYYKLCEKDQYITYFLARFRQFDLLYMTMAPKNRHDDWEIEKDKLLKQKIIDFQTR